MRAWLVVVVLGSVVACQGRASDDYPIVPGGGSVPGGGTGGVDAAIDDDAMRVIAGRVCVLGDLRNLTACAVSGAGGLGVLGVLIPLGVSFYYVFIETWCLGYCLQFVEAMFGGPGVGIDPNTSIETQTQTAATFFGNFVGAGANGAVFAPFGETAILWLVVIAVNIYFVFRGLSKGIEKFCSFAMPMMAVCATIVLIRVLTLPGQPGARTTPCSSRIFQSCFQTPSGEGESARASAQASAAVLR